MISHGPTQTHTNSFFKRCQVSGVRKIAHSSQLVAHSKRLEGYKAGKLEGLKAGKHGGEEVKN